MLYSETLLNLDGLPEPAKAALAGQTVALNHTTGQVTVPDEVYLMEFEKETLLKNNPRSDLYQSPAHSEWENKDQLDYQHSPELQREFGTLETWLAYRRNEQHVRIHGGKNAVVLSGQQS